MIGRLLARVAALALALWAAGPARADDLRVFFFGNSLIHHLTESDETAVPHWLALLAEAGGHGFAADGTFGFLPEFAANLPPEPEWRFDAVTRAWDGSVPFGRARFDAIILSPTSFIQSEPPDAVVDRGSAVALTAQTLGWAASQFPDGRRPRFLIYEGWSGMATVTDYPPGPRGLARWHNWNLGHYHDWYGAYIDRLNEELPGLDISLIPVSTVLSTLMTEDPLAAIPVEALYMDDPHGTPTTYLLAAMVTYAWLYGEAPPDLALPATIHPVLADNYDRVSARIAELTGAALRPGTVRDPSLGMGLSGVVDWSTQQPFLDIIKTGRPWMGHTPEEWGAWDDARLAAGGYLSPEGWPRAFPPGVDRMEMLVLSGRPAAARSLAGTYVLRWEGGAEVTVVGPPVGDVRRDGNSLRFAYRPGGDGLVAIVVTALDPDDPLRAMTLVREEHLALFEGGAVFDPAFLARIRDFRALRFMDWMATNNSTQVRWEDRPRVGDASWMGRGVPVEIMVQLANEVGADPWFTLPHQADDAYVLAFATYVRDHLDPRLKVHAEWSNEVWNFMFDQAHWAVRQAEERWGADGDAWMQLAGLRAAEVADIWAEVFGAQADARLVRVVGAHTGWLALADPLLLAPLAVAEGRPPPVESFDAYAVTGYFGHGVGAEDLAPTLRGWIGEGIARDRVTAMAREDVRLLTEETWPFHAQLAREHGLALMAYEGGIHIVGQGAAGEDGALTAFFTNYSYSFEVAQLYRELLAGWTAAGGTLFMAFVDVDAPSRWGSWGALRHPDDRNPRWGAILAANAVPPAWDSRDPATFAQGVQAAGGPAADTLTGTPEEDDLLGAAGDDVLVSGGGSDRLHGGDGRDRAALPGTAADWARGADGAATLMTRGAVTVRLTAVEEVAFGASGEVLVLAEAP